MSVRSMLAMKFGRILLAGGLSLATLSWVAAKVTTPGASVVVHVTEPDVALQIDNQIYRVAGLSFQPIECDLRAGDHRLVMSRGVDVLLDLTFRVEPGSDLVLTASGPR